MRRIIKWTEYRHDPAIDQNGVVLEVELQGASSTHLMIESISTGGNSTVRIEEVSTGRDGVDAVAGNEDMSRTEALGQIAGVLADVERAERMHRIARRGLSEFVLTQIIDEGTS